MKKGIGFFIGITGIIIDIIWGFNTEKIVLLVIGSLLIAIGYKLLGLDKVFGKKKKKEKSDYIQENSGISDCHSKNTDTLNQTSRTERDRLRMEKAGLKLYVWSTCGDERVCDACKIMDEKLCRWESPFVFSEDGGRTWKRRPEGAIMMHPGQHEGCRCTSLAYHPEIVGEI